MKTYICLMVCLLMVSVSEMHSQSIAKPEIIQFGETKSNIMLAFDQQAKIVSDKQIVPIQLPTAKSSQSQVDCEKFRYAGKKRKIELVFADGILDMVWILTLPEEEDTLIAGFTKMYGKPTHVKEDVTFFLDAGVAVRNDPHEVLFISDRLKPHYKAWLENH
ncbi:MAG: hypothetical protein P8100_11765 [bacterium]|jgi:hypothetical protein